ncbi:hypothetical protein GGH95_003966, partial [Coemansia sp. RSA 1836]
MASNSGGYYDTSHSQAQFRRATGRVDMANSAAGPPLPRQQPPPQAQALPYVHMSPSAPPLQQQVYSPPPPQYTVEQQMQPAYAPGSGSAMAHGNANSAIPAPHGYHQQQHHHHHHQMQHPGYQVRPMNGGYAPPHSQAQHAPPPQPLPPAGSHHNA